MLTPAWPPAGGFDHGVVEWTFPLPGGRTDPALESYLETVAGRESRADVASLRYLLAPRSIAVVGASRRAGHRGPRVLHNIVAGGFTGNDLRGEPRPTAPWKASRAWPRSADLPEAVDLAVIAVPAAAVPAVAAACGRRGVRALTVITAGLGAGGADLLAACRRYGMRLVGPNCLGIIVPGASLNATFAAARPRRARPAWSCSPAAWASPCWSSYRGWASACRPSPRSAISTTCPATTC